MIVVKEMKNNPTGFHGVPGVNHKGSPWRSSARRQHLTRGGGAPAVRGQRSAFYSVY